MRNPHLPVIPMGKVVDYLGGNKVFDAGSMWAMNEENGWHTAYCVYSYGVLIAKHENGVIKYFNAQKYSSTTSKHQNFVIKAWGLSGNAIKIEEIG